MALLAPKCDRCGRRTRKTQEDKPICEACAEEMDLIVQAGYEVDRLCPVDGTAMKKEVAHMLVIDRCPKCSGAWLDGGELERLKEGVQMEAVLATTRGLTSPLI
ncbi:MAG: zf-TFIIB domain-containing protein [Myxococcota bacterium]|nr:zf-TFIIB domain-containing protein [Myxococcota bacterium]